jgi:hypothetical protein
MSRKKFFWQRWPAPLRWFLLIVVGLLGLAFLFPPGPTSMDLNTARASTTSDKRLYFHNVRSFSYHRDPRSKAPMEIYRLKDVPPQWDSLPLRPQIILHPSQQKAFVHWAPGPDLKQKDSVFVTNGREDAKYPWHTESRWQAHFAIAGMMLRSLANEDSVWIQKADGPRMPAWPNQESRQAAQIILEDYFKLLAKPINHE